jgi:dephospho-CoA kinase
MRIIGLTGGIGSGKSSVSEMLRALGATVVDADEGARAVVEPGQAGYHDVVQQFGRQVLAQDGGIDRQKLADIVFADPEKRQQLNSITHPRVREWMAARVQEAGARDAKLVVLDIPLLYESGLEAGLGGVIVVWATPAQQLERAVARGGERRDIEARIAAQMPLLDKRDRATWVIDNSGSPDTTRRQVEELWGQLGE